jgi:hypothetical protein
MTAKKEHESNEKSEQPKLSKEQEIAFHKGSLQSLAAEYNELVRIIQNVQAIMQAHIKRLEELGVKIQTQKKEK